MSRRDNVAKYYMRTSNMHPKLCTAIASFFDEEVKLFDASVQPVVKKYPRFENAVLTFDKALYVPLDAAIGISQKKLPVYFEVLKNRRETLAFMLSQLDQGERCVDEEGSEVLRRYKEELAAYEALLEPSRENMVQFSEFIGRVLGKISKKYQGRLLLLPDDNDVRDPKFRNRVYRSALGEDHWLLGYDLKLMVGLSEAVAQENARMLEHYNSIGPVEKEVLFSSGDRTIFFPEPLGADTMTSKKYFEEVLPQMVESQPVKAYTALRTAVESHFEKRLADILGDN